jgi:hypothetical protein
MRGGGVTLHEEYISSSNYVYLPKIFACRLLNNAISVGKEIIYFPKHWYQSARLHGIITQQTVT